MFASSYQPPSLPLRVPELNFQIVLQHWCVCGILTEKPSPSTFSLNACRTQCCPPTAALYNKILRPQRRRVRQPRQSSCARHGGVKSSASCAHCSAATQQQRQQQQPAAAGRAAGQQAAVPAAVLPAAVVVLRVRSLRVVLRLVRLTWHASSAHGQVRSRLGV